MSTPAFATSYQMAQSSSAGPGGRMRESSRNARSSRRTRVSTGANVQLGGGVGSLGMGAGGRSVSNPISNGMGKEQIPHPFSAAHLYASASPHSSTASHSPQFPVDFSSASPTSPGFPSPIAQSFPHSHIKRAPSPLAPINPPPRQSSAKTDVRPSHSGSTNPGSTSSLSTTASSSSSRTLKTPHSKLDPHAPQPTIASSSSLNSHASYGSPTPAMPLKERERGPASSPTPTQRTVSSVRSNAPRERLPAVPQGPLPPTPASSSTPPNMRIGTKPLSVGARTKGPPAPLELAKKENRLSQDWVQIDYSMAENQPLRAKSTSPLLPEAVVRGSDARGPGRLPGATMIPMKADVLSPRRPSYERSHTAPPMSPPADEGRPQREGRASMDHMRNLRSTSPTPVRGRQNSLSTPPAAILGATTTPHSTGGRLSLFRNASAKSPPQLRTRRSEDLMRPSLDASRAGPSKKDTKAISKEQHKALGIANGSWPSVPLNHADGERKSSGLSLKKSSGALKALFARGAGGKGKDRAETPPVPLIDERKIAQGRPSLGSRIESSPLPSRGARSFTPNAAARLDASGGQAPIQQEEPGRRSLGVERAMFPAAPLHRTMSQGSNPALELPTYANGTRMRLPSRELPPLPPPSPLPPREGSTSASSTKSGGTPKSGSTESIASGTEPETKRSKPQLSQLSTLAEALPTSSLPYLSPLRASFLMEQTEAAALGIPGAPTSASMSTSPGSLTTGQSSASSSTPSDSTTRPSPNWSAASEQQDLTPLPTAKSLHLLSLPELDLNFDMPFDRFGVSPSTPRKLSPLRAKRGSPASPTPQRSLTTRASPSPRLSPQIKRNRSDRRRSRSFDGENRPVITDFWQEATTSFVSPSVAQFFAAANCSSAPAFSAPLAPESAEDRRERSRSRSPAAKIILDPPSAPSSMDHARTPSNASTTNETPSPSPPQTPEQVHSDSVFGFGSPSRTLASLANAEMEAKPYALGLPPNIPLPALPTEAQVTPVLAPAAPIKVSEPEKPAQVVVKPARENRVVLVNKSSKPLPDASVTTQALARDVEQALYAFRAPSAMSSGSDRSSIIRSDLLPLLTEIDKRPFDKEEPAAKALRTACFDWIDSLMFELNIEQPAHERGACLEGLAGILESSSMSERALRNDARHTVQFTEAMIKIMTFVMGKLGSKGVFHNTLLFSGRFLAFAFFRVPHIGEQLVTVLQLPRGALMRFTRTAVQGPSLPAHAKPQYPKHLSPLCFDNSRAYTARLAGLSAEFGTEKERDAFLFRPGNWLRRWQSDDSELFPAFYRAYHRQLATYLAPAVEYYESLDLPLPASVLLRAPGYAHLATIFSKKCHSYILGSVNAVTTSSSTSNFDATESAGFKGSQKPVVLETANRRLVETISTFINTRITMPGTQGHMIECDGQQLWSGMLDLWTKNLISKTSLYAPKGVFSLFDLLDGIVDPALDPISGERQLKESSLLDVPHLIHVIRLILAQGEHALTLVKVIAFIFTHWEVLTARIEDREELCLDLLLDKELFERLMLFWSQSVRSYILRLVVFRLGHLHTQKSDGLAHDVEIESVRLLQTRLDGIKRRHDELEPKSGSSDVEEKEEPYLTPLDGGSLPRSRSTITMVTDSPRTGSTQKAEKLLGLGLGDFEQGRGEIGETNTKMGKATNWLKKSFGKQKKRSPSASPNALGTSPIVDPISPVFPYVPPEGAETKGFNKFYAPSSPSLPSPASSGESSSPTTESTRRARPPAITTSEPSPIAAEKSPNSFAFEFELPLQSPRSDSFDPTPTPTPGSPSKRASAPPSPRQPSSPHMSKSFSKRSSLLPPPTASILAETPSRRRRSEDEVEDLIDVGYDAKLHAYAIRMLAELEDAQKEYDEWWAPGGVGRMDGAPPRLTVAWPFHEGED